MLSSVHPILSYFLLFLSIMLGINLSAPTGEAAPDEVAGTTPSSAAAESISAEKIEGIEGTSSQTFSFDGVYQIALNLDVPGNVEVVATDSDLISIALENREQKQTSVKAYFDSITLTGAQEEGTLRLKLKLPDDASKALSESQSTHAIKQQLQLNYVIKTPADVSVQIQAKAGDIRLQRIRGKIEIATDTGNVHLDETLGNYNVSVMEGRVYGKILLTHGQNKIETQNGSIDLVVLDTVATPLDLTARGGGIRLRLPENYAADVEFESEKQQVVINIPSQIEDNIAFINEGGPLLRLIATDSILLGVLGGPNTPSESAPTDVAPDALADSAQPVPKTVHPPTIDGNLSEKAWRTAAALSPFQNPEGTETPKNPTEAFLMWDAQNFYIGAKAYIANWQVPRISQTQQDSPVWEDESVEILLDANPQTEVYYHLIVNPIGALFDQQVNAAGEPNFRFAPADVQRRTQDSATKQFKAEHTWNSGAKVATQINAAFWSFEVALPRKVLKQNSKNTWLFNMHRKALGDLVTDFHTRQLMNTFNRQQNTRNNTDNLELPESTTQGEYSYWLPTYDAEHPWWPHRKEAMGALTLVTAQSSTLETFHTEEMLEVTAIEIEGNTTIPTDVVLQQIPMEPGEVVTNAHLSWLITELKNHDWFQTVHLETVVPETGEHKSPLSPLHEQSPADKTENPLPAEPLKVIVRIRVTEAPVQFARHIDITGNRSFPAQFIKDWFRLEPGYLAVASVKLKQQLIANFYWNRGYEFAKTTYQFAADSLQFTVDEGTLDEIRFTGNDRISYAELASALELETERVYYRTLGQAKINSMRKQLSENNPHFKSIQNWRVQREGGKNILVVDIEEQPSVKPSGVPIFGFNRVHGLVLGAGGKLSTRFAGEGQIFGSVTRGFSSKIWNYNAGIEKNFFKRHAFKFGGGFFKLTDISHNNHLLPTQANLSAAFYGSAQQDYYQRQGYQTWIARAFGTSAYLRLEFTQENHENLSKSTDWSYLYRHRIKRGNPRIERGQLRMLSFSYAFDTRDQKLMRQRPQNMGSYMLFWPNERTRRGWRGFFAIQTAGQRLGGDFAFNSYAFELARYTPLLGPHHLNIRLAGDFSDTPLPKQRLLYLGGAATLRGYNYHAFAGDNSMLLNIEYRFIKETLIRATTPNAVLGWTLSCFLDTGQAWWADENPFADAFMRQLKTSIGIGFSLFLDPVGEALPWSVAAEIAQPLGTSFSLRNPKLILRFERIF